jgi:DNA repair protein RecO (recombination protein O)
LNQKIEAIILKSKDIKEVDRIYTVFSREKGKSQIVARGVRKPMARLAGGLEPLTYSEIFVVPGRWMDKATGVIIVDQFKKIKASLELIVQVKTIFQAVDLLCGEKDPNEKLFFLLKDFLFLLEETGWKSSSVAEIGMSAVLLKILVLTGMQPSFYYCPGCGKKIEAKEFYWLHMPLGIECGTCESSQFGRRMKINADVVKILRFLMTQPLEISKRLRVDSGTLFQVRRVCAMMYEEVTGKRVLH